MRIDLAAGPGQDQRGIGRGYRSAALAASHSASISASVEFLRSLAALGQRPFDGGEAALEFPVGLPQHRLRIGAQMPGQIDRGEQQIADLCGRRAVAGIERGLDLVGFLADLAQHRARIVPVESDLAGLCLKL